MMNFNLTLIAEYVWVIVAVIVMVVLLIKNLAYRQQVAQLKKRLQQSNGYQAPLEYLRSQKQLQFTQKVMMIKALRQQYPELSLLEAAQIWQHVYDEQNPHSE